LNGENIIAHSKNGLGAKIAAGVVWGQIGMSLRSLISFLAYILISRSLGAHDFGLYSAIVSLIAILLYFTDMGIYSVFNNYLPQLENENKSGAVSYLIRRALLAKIAIFAIVSMGMHRYIGFLADWTGEPVVKDYVFSGRQYHYVPVLFEICAGRHLVDLFCPFLFAGFFFRRRVSHNRFTVLSFG